METLFPIAEVAIIAMFFAALLLLLVYALWDTPFHRRSGHTHRLFASRERRRLS